MFKTIQEALDYCKKNDIKMVDFKMVDLTGRWRHLTLPIDRFTEKTMQWGLGFDGSNYGYAPIEKSDMVFIPDLSSAVEEPFADMPTISMIGDVCSITDHGFEPFDQYPRNVAKAAAAYLEKSGVADTILLGPEFEMFIFDSVAFRNDPQCISLEIDSSCAEWNTQNIGNGYQCGHKGAYHISAPHDITFGIRNRIACMLEERNVPVKYHHTEVGGPGQVEFELSFGDLVTMADRSMMVKYIVKNQAEREGLTATFMPKPVYGEAGNGMHVHMMLRKNGQPVFADPNGYSGLSQTALYFIGGILKHAASLCGLTNPSTNSYKRLVPGYEAPTTIGFATANRSAVIRVPAYAKAADEKRFELRSIDATCNPYYAYAAILMAGMDGLKNKIDPAACGWGPFDFNLYNLSEEEQAKISFLPKTLEEALAALKADHDYLLEGGVFSERLIEIWINKKMSEAKAINAYPHPAEFKYYYDL